MVNALYLVFTLDGKGIFKFYSLDKIKGGGGFDKDGKGIFEFYGFGKKYMYRA